MWLALILIVVIIAIFAYLDTRKPTHFPPGPPWWPFIGSGLEVIKLKKKMGYFVTASAHIARTYGPVLGLKVGKEKLVVICGTKVLKECLTSDSLSGRPVGDFYDMRTWGKRRGILLIDEDYWQEQRRFIIRHLREFGFGTTNMSTIIEEEAQELVDYVYKTINEKDSVIFQGDTLFNVSILNTIWTMLAGARYGPGDPKMMELQSILNDLFSNILMLGAPFSHYPILKYLAPELSGYNLYVRTHLRLWDFLRNELEHHKETHNPEEPRDFMDVYLNAIKMTDNLDNYTEEQLVAICLDLFMAGSETTNNSMGFCFLGLILYPEVQKKAQEEIDTIIGKHRTPTLQDRPNMPYVECVVLEALRMFGGRALSVPRRALKDTHVDGYVIPKDTLIVPNFYDAMLAPYSKFDSPTDFVPERYLKDGKILVPDDFIPFSLGKHRCLGETLARANLFVFTSTMLQKFNFSTIPEHRPSLMEWREGLTPGPKPFKMKVIPRV